jgi:transcriptional regulator with XRE-family HTH domain
MQSMDYSLNFRKLGLKIAYYRKVKGYTQETLSELMGVATSYVGAIEAPNMNKPISLSTLFKIAEILEIPAWKFLDFE